MIEGLNLIFNGIENERTVIEWKQYICGCYDEIIERRKVEEARYRVGFAKQFFEEIVPLYIYASLTSEDEDSKYKLVIGNQKYDAICVSQNRKLEFTSYFDGYNYHKRMEEISAYGVSKPIVGDVYEAILKYLEEFNRLAQQKSQKEYDDNVLIVFVINNEFHDFLFEDNEKYIIDKMISVLHHVDFGANEVMLLHIRGGFTNPSISKVHKVY